MGGVEVVGGELVGWLAGRCILLTLLFMGPYPAARGASRPCVSAQKHVAEAGSLLQAAVVAADSAATTR